MGFGILCIVIGLIIRPPFGRFGPPRARLLTPPPRGDADFKLQLQVPGAVLEIVYLNVAEHPQKLLGELQQPRLWLGHQAGQAVRVMRVGEQAG